MIQPVENFKALSYRLLIFGFQPADLIIAGVMLYILNMFTSSLYVNAVFFLVAYYILKKGKKRPDSFFKSFCMFIVTPHRAAVHYENDISSYKSVLDNP